MRTPIVASNEVGTKFMGFLAAGLFLLNAQTQIQSATVTPDFVWHHPTTLNNAIWIMNNSTMTASSMLWPDPPTDPNPDWLIMATGDFNADGQTDIVWQHNATEEISVWLMDRQIMKSTASFNPSLAGQAGWRIVGVADFNLDNKPDLLWQHTAGPSPTGMVAIWYMDGTEMTCSTLTNPSTPTPSDWRILGTADFNADNKPDLLWQAPDGTVAIWYMNGATMTGSTLTTPSNPGEGWRIVDAADFDLDLKPDIVWQHTGGSNPSGMVALWYMNGATMTSSTVTTPSTPTPSTYRMAAVGDFSLITDSDNDGLPDAWENQFFGSLTWNRTHDPDNDALTNEKEYQAGLNPNSTDSDGDGIGDLLEYELSFNVIVNSRPQDCETDENGRATEQNSQFESSCAVLNGRVIVAFVDSNQILGPAPRSGGVYAFGSSGLLPNRTPRFVAYSILDPGASLFKDKGNPPVSTLGTPGDTSDDGDAGDPVLAVDKASSFVYMVGTSMRRTAGYKGIPLWKSTDGGVTFGDPITVRSEIIESDKPWIAVDNAAGTGQHDVYITFSGTVSPQKIWLAVSTDGEGATWNTLQQIQGGDANILPHAAIPVVASDHAVYVFWIERETVATNTYRNHLKVCKVTNRGQTVGPINPIRTLVTTHENLGDLELKRSNTAQSSDTFRVSPLPVPAVNPSTSKANHLYVAYADKPQNGDPNDRADVFFLRSTNGGTNWDGGTSGASEPTRLSTGQINDQWMPVLAVKDDGTKLFVAWYDRRNDSNNSLIDVYGRWATIAADGTVAFGTEFKITTTSFPPVFGGTLPDNTNVGHYDPVYPPFNVNLHWWYPEWPEDNLEQFRTLPTWSRHVGEYNGAWVDGAYVYFSWTDYRLTHLSSYCQGSPSECTRNQSDIRFIRLTWPQ
ncbi:MAG: VCBS repeat-containing protein [Verrucomicrobia bacterium]|nr:VCBS repeat-containing protein [Verrucomicrobiota bacterium]